MLNEGSWVVIVHMMKKKAAVVRVGHFCLLRRSYKAARLAQVSPCPPSQAAITTPVTPHTIRHSFATHLLEGGADIVSIFRLLGHGDLKAIEIYTRVDARHLHEKLL